MTRGLIVGLIACFSVPAWSTPRDTGENTAKAEPQVLLEEGTVYLIQGQAKTALQLPGAASAVHLRDQTVYVALLEKGAAVVDLRLSDSGVKIHHIPVSHGRVTGFFELDGQLWMHVDSTTAVLLEEGVGTPRSVIPLTAPLPEAAQPTATAGGELPTKKALTSQSTDSIRILARYPGELLLDGGADQGVKIGDRFAALRQTPIESPHEAEFKGDELVAVIEVIAVNKTRSLAILWRGDRVAEGDRLVPAQPIHTQSKVYPRRLDKLGELTAVIRPLLNVGTPRGFGALCEVKGAYYGEFFFADLKMQPLGFGWTKDGNVLSASFLAEGGYDSRAFAIGLGAGVGSVNGDLNRMLEASGDSSDNGSEPAWHQRTKAAFALSQIVRLGARDGLNLVVTNLLLYHRDDDRDEEGFIYGGTSGRFAFPLAKKTEMYIEGGGGLMGYWFGAVGVFTWMRGNGDAGSLGLSVSAGAAGVWGNRERDRGDFKEVERVAIGGPMIALGLSYRFGFSTEHKKE